MNATLYLEDKTDFSGKSFGANQSVTGELVFSTGMMGYPESLTDPSYKGQILVLTYPLIGNYGVPKNELWESEKIMISGLIVSSYNQTPSHFQSKRTLGKWLQDENIPALEIKDTRLLTQKIRDKGAMLAGISFDSKKPFSDPNKQNLVREVSTQSVTTHLPKKKKTKKSLLLIDCGAKRNIQNALLKRGVKVTTIPWDFDPFTKSNKEILEKKNSQKYDAIVISNGPGDPKKADKTIQIVQQALSKNIPVLGICLGNQILTLAAGGNTSKMKFGHRSQNQPCIMTGTKKCYITTQNHGFAVNKIPSGFKEWFANANDGTNEGIIHKQKPVMSVQFHPEATPGPEDTEWIFDYFLKKL